MNGDGDNHQVVPFYSNGSIFGKNLDDGCYYIFDPYPSIAGARRMYKFPDIDQLCANLPRLIRPLLWHNYYHNEDLNIIVGFPQTRFIKLTEAELVQIEKFCISGEKVFQRLGDANHPALTTR